MREARARQGRFGANAFYVLGRHRGSKILKKNMAQEFEIENRDRWSLWLGISVSRFLQIFQGGSAMAQRKPGVAIEAAPELSDEEVSQVCRLASGAQKRRRLPQRY